jgi:hypothetical protein
MPGIVTHNHIFRHSVKLLSSRKKRSYILNSLRALFNTSEFFSAALFGSIGPNIFDYIPKRNKKSYFGHNVSFFLHDGGLYKLLLEMTERIISCSDKNNEWAAMQRAYLYGVISHAVVDTLYHPFMFYWSGFPDSYNKKEINYYREQYLLFTYNMDNYFAMHDDRVEFTLDEMLPVKISGKKMRLREPLKQFILETLSDVYPEIFKDLILKREPQNENGDRKIFDARSYLDYLPYLIKKTYWLKHTENRRVVSLLKMVKKRDLFNIDFITRYPQKRYINNHVLNLHREAWKSPSGKPGNRYESVDHLMKSACEKTVEIWERIEESLWGNNDIGVMEQFKANSYTGEEGIGYYDMKEKNPVKLVFRF